MIMEIFSLGLAMAAAFLLGGIIALKASQMAMVWQWQKDNNLMPTMGLGEFMQDELDFTQSEAKEKPVKKQMRAEGEDPWADLGQNVDPGVLTEDMLNQWLYGAETK